MSAARPPEGAQPPPLAQGGGAARAAGNPGGGYPVSTAPPFQAEKQRATSPAARGTGTGRFRNAGADAGAPAPPADPAVTPPYSKLRVRDRYDCEEMARLAAGSSTFSRHLATLRERKVEIDYRVGKLPAAAGGGRTVPHVGHRKYEVYLDPETVHPGYHVFDVFLHEHGHVAEYQRVAFDGAREGGYYLLFMNTVQAELGLRVTPDSHPTARNERRAR